jgi:hypothetical protein
MTVKRSLESAGDAAQCAGDGQTQGGQSGDADYCDEGQKQTVLGQRLPILGSNRATEKGRPGGEGRRPVSGRAN